MRRSNADAGLLDGWAITRVKGRGVVWTTVLNAFSREQGVPGDGLVPTLAGRQATRRSLAAVRAAVACGEDCEITVGTSVLLSTMRLDDPRRELGLGSDALAIDAARVSPMARAHFRPFEALAVSLASDLAHESLSRKTAGNPTEEATRNFGRVATQATLFPDGFVTLAALGAAERNSTTFTGTTGTAVAPVAGRASLKVGGPRLAALANLGSAVRVPTLGELYGQSPTLGGNPLLKPERGTTLDAGVRASGPLGPFAAELDAFGFARAVDDLVAYRRANFVAARPYNVASATVRGAELGVALALPRRLRMSEALTLLDARDDATALPLPLRPRLVSASRITLSFGEAMGLAGADMGLTLIRQSSRYADPAALTVLPHQTHLDADVSISVDVGGALMTTRARIANVTGAERFDLVGYPLPPRQVFLTVDVLHE